MPVQESVCSSALSRPGFSHQKYDRARRAVQVSFYLTIEFPCHPTIGACELLILVVVEALPSKVRQQGTRQPLGLDPEEVFSEPLPISVIVEETRVFRLFPDDCLDTQILGLDVDLLQERSPTGLIRYALVRGKDDGESRIREVSLKLLSFFTSFDQVTAFGSRLIEPLGSQPSSVGSCVLHPYESRQFTVAYHAKTVS